MSNLLLTVNIVLPIFLVMAVGFFAREIHLTNDSITKGMNKLVFRVFLPCSLCKSIMTADRNMQINWWLLGFCIAGDLVVFLLVFLIVPRLEKSDKRRGVIMQAIFRGNYAIFGLPLAEALFPQGDGGVAAMMVLATVPVYNVLAVVTLEYYRGGKCTPMRLIKGVLKNPLLWGCAAGFIFLKMPWRMPSVVTSTISKLGTIAGPLALFVLGASINPGKLAGNVKTITLTTISRLVLVPLVTMVPAYFLGFRGPEFAALMVAFVTPTATSSFTMASEMDADGDLAAQLVMSTSMFSMFTIFFIILICKTAGIF